MKFLALEAYIPIFSPPDCWDEMLLGIRSPWAEYNEDNDDKPFLSSAVVS